MDEIIDGSIFVVYNEGCNGDVEVFIGCITFLNTFSFSVVFLCISPPSEVGTGGSIFPVYSPSVDAKDEDVDSSIIGERDGVVSLCSIFATFNNAPFVDDDVDCNNGFVS